MAVHVPDALLLADTDLSKQVQEKAPTGHVHLPHLSSYVLAVDPFPPSSKIETL